jgi:hypothetical protein
MVSAVGVRGDVLEQQLQQERGAVRQQLVVLRPHQFQGIEHTAGKRAVIQVPYSEPPSY